MNFIYHHDAGHGWLEVPATLVKELGIKISACSYKREDKAYLEEDCDAPLFLKSLQSHGIDYEIADKYDGNHSPIRNFAHYE